MALVPGGRLTTLEFDPHHAEVARRNLDRAGLAGVVDVRVGAALDTLPTLAGGDLFDLVFIDADKVTYPQYLEWAIQLTRPGALIIADNVVRRGGVAAPGGDAPPPGARLPGGAGGRPARRRDGRPDGGEQGLGRLLARGPRLTPLTGAAGPPPPAAGVSSQTTSG